MSAMGFVQLVADVALFFMILLLFVGRGWKRGQGAREEQESYREMLSSLTVLIREMKETAADLEERGARKQLELQRAVAAADERLAALQAAEQAAPRPYAGGVGAAPRPDAAGIGAAPRPDAAGIGAAPRPDAAGIGSAGRSIEGGVNAPAAPGPARGAVSRPSGEAGGMDEDERREKYRIALDFARKGWNALEIARHTQLPRGEVELLIKTRGGPLGGGG